MGMTIPRLDCEEDEGKHLRRCLSANKFHLTRVLPYLPAPRLSMFCLSVLRAHLICCGDRRGSVDELNTYEKNQESR